MKIGFSEARAQRDTRVQWKDKKTKERDPMCVHPQERNRSKKLRNFRNENHIRVFSEKKEDTGDIVRDLEDRLEKNWGKVKWERNKKVRYG